MWSASSFDVLASSILALASGSIVGQPPIATPPAEYSIAAASEQATRSLSASAIMRTLWRISYTVGGVPGLSDWTPIGETVTVPAGAVFVGAEYDGAVIDGGPWYVVGGEPRT